MIKNTSRSAFMNTSVKRNIQRFRNQTFRVRCAKDLVCGRTMGPHSVAGSDLYDLFCRAAPFIVLSSSFAQRSLYEAHTKGCGLAQALVRALEEA